MPIDRKDRKNLASPAPEKTKKTIRPDSDSEGDSDVDSGPDSPRVGEKKEDKKEKKKTVVESDDDVDSGADSEDEREKRKQKEDKKRDKEEDKKREKESKSDKKDKKEDRNKEREKPKEEEPEPPKKSSSKRTKQDSPPKKKTADSDDEKEIKSVKQRIKDIIPDTDNKPVNVKLERYKVSIIDFDPERVVVGEANPIPVEIPDEKTGKVQKLTHYSHTMEYNYPERPMYTANSIKSGTYPAEKDILVLGSLPPLVSKSGFNEIKGKYYYYMTLELCRFTPEKLTDDEKEALIADYEAQLVMFKTKMDRMGVVVGEQLAALQREKKCFIDDLWDKQEKKKGKYVIIDNPSNVISEFVRWQKRNDVVDLNAPQVLKLSLNKGRRGNIDASVVTFTDKEVLPPKDWDLLKSSCLTLESDILFPQVYCTDKAVYLQTLARSTMVLDAKETVSVSTQNERADYWGSKDAGRADSVRKQLQSAQQKLKEKQREKENASKEETSEDIEADKVSGGDILNTAEVDMSKSKFKRKVLE